MPRTGLIVAQADKLKARRRSLDKVERLSRRGVQRRRNAVGGTDWSTTSYTLLFAAGSLVGASHLSPRLLFHSTTFIFSRCFERYLCP